MPTSDSIPPKYLGIENALLWSLWGLDRDWVIQTCFKMTLYDQVVLLRRISSLPSKKLCELTKKKLFVEISQLQAKTVHQQIIQN